MKIKRETKAYVIFILISEAVGVISGLLSREGMKVYSETAAKPPLSPPAILFPIVWAILYGLMGIGAARVFLSRPSGERTVSLRLFAGQLVLNFFWSIIFFAAGAYGGAFFWLLALLAITVAMTVFFSRIDKPAAYLQIPYIVWLVFAAYLNLGTWILN